MIDTHRPEAPAGVPVKRFRPVPAGIRRLSALAWTGMALGLLAGCLDDETTGPADPGPGYQDSAVVELQLVGMGPYVTHQVSISIVDDTTGAVSADTVLEPLAKPDIRLSFGRIADKRRTYRIDIHADLNQNKAYDAPPVDHAWRRRFSPLRDIERPVFRPDTAFVNIQALPPAVAPAPAP